MQVKSNTAALTAIHLGGNSICWKDENTCQSNLFLYFCNKINLSNSREEIESYVRNCTRRGRRTSYSDGWWVLIVSTKTQVCVCWLHGPCMIMWLAVARWGQLAHWLKSFLMRLAVLRYFLTTSHWTPPSIGIKGLRSVGEGKRRRRFSHAIGGGAIIDVVSKPPSSSSCYSTHVGKQTAPGNAASRQPAQHTQYVLCVFAAGLKPYSV
jgi:hypothetical protein